METYFQTVDEVKEKMAVLPKGLIHMTCSTVRSNRKFTYNGVDQEGECIEETDVKVVRLL